MLDELRVRNLGIIEEATLYPGRGLTVLTGETGAGKTLLLGALRLLLGAEGRPDLVGPFADEAVVEGRFLFAGSEITASRRLQRVGRGRAYLDGSIASTRALAEALAEKVDIIGQHDHLSLTKAAAVRSLLDSNLDAGGRALIDRYRQVRHEWEGLAADQERLGGDRRALTRELDLVGFQSGEISRAGFVAGDEQDLEHMANRLRHAETLSLQLAGARAAVEAGLEALGGAVAEL
ncbi:MAG TPA: AAA family ATPase, partial [Acidimicrobiia bacterium]|nr:AAA family ATPase [Acidimicrobiia bacterium]